MIHSLFHLSCLLLVWSHFYLSPNTIFPIRPPISVGMEVNSNAAISSASQTDFTFEVNLCILLPNIFPSRPSAVILSCFRRSRISAKNLGLTHEVAKLSLLPLTMHSTAPCPLGTLLRGQYEHVAVQSPVRSLTFMYLAKLSRTAYAQFVSPLTRSMA